MRVGARILTLGIAFGLYASSVFAADNRPEFKDPPLVQSVDGVLSHRMVVAPATIEVGGKKVTTLLYNGLFAPPTLSLHPGEVLKLQVVNARDEGGTNVHYHGANVSPKAPGDDIYIGIHPGESYEYAVHFPSDHPQGLFYYHPHWHGTTEYQIGSGLSGLLSLGSALDRWPELKGITTRYMILRDIQIVDGRVPDPPDPGKPTMRLVNGLLNPKIPIRPGEVQLWRVGNIGADIFYDLEIEGHKIYEIARDGITHNRLIAVNRLLLPTSSRSDFLVVGGPPGEYVFRTRSIDMGPAGDPHPRTTLATVISAGEPKHDKLPTEFPQLADLRNTDTCCERTFDYSETPDGSKFCINNVGADMGIINTKVRIGCVEEWTINNCTAENHTFHHHQLQFQVVKINGEDVPFTGLVDNVEVPYRAATREFPNRCRCDNDGNCHGCTCPTSDDPRGQVVVRIPYLNDVIEGRAVYHCHIGEHEDGGMMQFIEMSKTAGQCEPGTPSAIDRHLMTSKERAVCKPMTRKHDHTSAPAGLKIVSEPDGLWRQLVQRVTASASSTRTASFDALLAGSICYGAGVAKDP